MKLTAIRIVCIFAAAFLAVTANAPAACAGEGTNPAALTLEEGLKLATEEGRVVRIAAYNTGMAEEDISIARSRYFPTVTASAGYTMLAYQPGALISSRPVRTSERNFGSFSVMAHETLYDFGARSAAYRAAQESSGIARMDLNRTRNLVALDFITAYFTLLESDRLVAVAGREVDALNSHHLTAKSLFEAGTITKNDLLQAEVKLSDAKQRLLTTRNLRTLNASRINSIIARPLQEPVTPVDPAGEIPDALPLPAAWQTAEQKRHELQIMDRQLSILGLQETARRADFFPTLFAEGGYSYTQNKFQLHEDNWSLMGGLKINLFSGGSTRAELRKISLQTGQLREQRMKLVDDIRLEVERYHLEETNARENAATAKDALGQSEENLRITRLRYQEGIGTATDVLDAIALRSLAEKNYFKALYDLRRARAALLYAMGEDLTKAYR